MKKRQEEEEKIKYRECVIKKVKVRGVIERSRKYREG